MRAMPAEFVYLLDDRDRARLASEVAAQGEERPLSGLTLGVKDLFDIAGLPTTAGNPDWQASHPVPTQTSPVILQLVAAGATVVGKTLTDELAYSLNGINVHYPVPVNPAAPERLPGGSSSGSAVAVANGGVVIGLGTDTGGSIRVPASYNGLYGIRTSHGAISCKNMVPLATGFDTVGWMTQHLDDLVKVAELLLPPVPRLSYDNLAIVIPEGVVPQWPAWAERILMAVAFLFHSVQLVALPHKVMAQASEAFRVLQGRQIWLQHGQWIEEQNPTLAGDIRDRLLWCQGLNYNDETNARDLAAGFGDFWRNSCGINAKTLVVMPTTPGAAPLLSIPTEQLAEYRIGLMGLTAPAGLLAAPQLTLPLLQDHQAPWGLSLMGGKGSDRSLLTVANNLLPKLQQALEI